MAIDKVTSYTAKTEECSNVEYQIRAYYKVTSRTATQVTVDLDFQVHFPRYWSSNGSWFNYKGVKKSANPKHIRGYYNWHASTTDTTRKDGVDYWLKGQKINVDKDSDTVNITVGYSNQQWAEGAFKNHTLTLTVGKYETTGVNPPSPTGASQDYKVSTVRPMVYLNVNSVSFYWSAVQGTTSNPVKKYAVQVQSSPYDTFTGNVTTYPTIETTQTTFEYNFKSTDRPGAFFRVRVATIDSNGKRGEWTYSEKAKRRIPVEIPFITSPQSNTVIKENTPLTFTSLSRLQKEGNVLIRYKITGGGKEYISPFDSATTYYPPWKNFLGKKVSISWQVRDGNYTSSWMNGNNYIENGHIPVSNVKNVMTTYPLDRPIEAGKRYRVSCYAQFGEGRTNLSLHIGENTIEEVSITPADRVGFNKYAKEFTAKTGSANLPYITLKQNPSGNSASLVHSLQIEGKEEKEVNYNSTIGDSKITIFPPVLSTSELTSKTMISISPPRVGSSYLYNVKENVTIQYAINGGPWKALKSYVRSSTSTLTEVIKEPNLYSILKSKETLDKSMNIDFRYVSIINKVTSYSEKVTIKLTIPNSNIEIGDLNSSTVNYYPMDRTVPVAEKNFEVKIALSGVSSTQRGKIFILLKNLTNRQSYTAYTANILGDFNKTITINTSSLVAGEYEVGYRIEYSSPYTHTKTGKLTKFWVAETPNLTPVFEPQGIRQDMVSNEHESNEFNLDYSLKWYLSKAYAIVGAEINIKDNTYNNTIKYSGPPILLYDDINKKKNFQNSLIKLSDVKEGDVFSILGARILNETELTKPAENALIDENEFNIPITYKFYLKEVFRKSLSEKVPDITLLGNKTQTLEFTVFANTVCVPKFKDERVTINRVSRRF